MKPLIILAALSLIACGGNETPTGGANDLSHVDYRLYAPPPPLYNKVYGNGRKELERRIADLETELEYVRGVASDQRELLRCYQIWVVTNLDSLPDCK